MLYDIIDHPLLTDDARDLEPLDLEAHVRVAETLLGLLKFTAFAAGTDFYARASDAVALQVNYQAAAGIDAFTMANERRGARSMTYRGRTRMPPIHPMARKIISGIKPPSITFGGR